MTDTLAPAPPARAAPPPPRPARWAARWGLVLARVVGPGAEAAVAGAAVAIAALPWRHAYHVGGFLPALIVAAVAPVFVAYALAGWARQRPVVSYSASVLGALLVLGVVLGPHPSALADGVARGPSHLFTDTLPLSAPYWVVVVPLVVTWVAGAVAGEVLVRGHNPGPAMAVILVEFVCAFAGASAAPGSSLGIGVALVAALAVLSLVRQSPWRSRADARRGPSTGAGGGRAAARRAVTGAVSAVVVALLLWAVVPSLPGLHPNNDSLTRHPGVTPAPATNPLDTIAQLRDENPGGPASALFVLSTDEPSSGYVALAAFDSYDGDDWSFDRTYLPTGGRIPAPPAGEPAAVGPLLTQRYTMTKALPTALPFVPFVDHPTAVSGLAVDADAASGTFVPANAPTVGESYTVVSKAPVTTLADVPADAHIASAGTTGIQLPAVVSSDLAPTVTYLATLTHQTPAPTVSFLQAVVTSLDRTDKRLLPTQTQGSGTSLAEVVSAVTVDHAATPEQFATLLAVTARSLGVPARVVTGFRVVNSPTATLPAGRVTVTNREAWTWVEIPIVGLGWVVVDPTPAATTTVPTPPSPAQAGATSTTTTPAQNAVPSSPGVSIAVAPPVHIALPHHHRRNPLWIVLLVVVAALAAAGVVFGSAAGWRTLRRVRRRHASGPTAAGGAWLDVLDTMTRAGVEPGRAATSSEVVDLVGRSFGPDLVEPVATVAAASDRALFSARSAPDPATRREEWAAAIRFGQELRSRLPPSQRLRGALRVGGPSRRH